MARRIFSAYEKCEFIKEKTGQGRYGTDRVMSVLNGEYKALKRKQVQLVRLHLFSAGIGATRGGQAEISHNRTIRLQCLTEDRQCPGCPAR